MGKHLDIDDCCAMSELAKEQLKTLRRTNTKLYAFALRVSRINPFSKAVKGGELLTQLVAEAKLIAPINRRKYDNEE